MADKGLHVQILPGRMGGLLREGNDRLFLRALVLLGLFLRFFFHGDKAYGPGQARQSASVS